LRVTPSKRLGAQSLLRTKEIVIHLRESGIEEEKKESSTNLLDTIKLPSNFKLLKERLPSAKYDSALETIEPTKPKVRNYSARGKTGYDLNGNLRKENSYSALQRYKNKPYYIGRHQSNNRVEKCQRAALLPPKSNRHAHYNRNYDRPGLQLPPIPKATPGIPSIPNYRNRASSIDHRRLLPPRKPSSNRSLDYDAGCHRRKADIATRHKRQQKLISKAFGLPNTKIM